MWVPMAWRRSRPRTPRANRPPARRRPAPWALAALGGVLLLLGLALAWRQQTTARQPRHEPEAIPIAVNFAAPDLSLTGLDGTPQRLADWGGQVVLINLWATWCPPCRAEMPTLEAYYRDHADQGFLVWAVESGGEPRDTVAAFVHRYGLTFPVAWDPENRAMLAFRVQALPSSFVVDRQGRVRWAWTGPISRATLERVVTPLLESP